MNGSETLQLCMWLVGGGVISFVSFLIFLGMDHEKKPMLFHILDYLRGKHD